MVIFRGYLSHNVTYKEHLDAFIETCKVKFSPPLCGEDICIKLNIKRGWVG